MLCRKALLRYVGNVEDRHLVEARGISKRELAALRQHIWEMLNSQTCRFHLRFVTVVARRAEEALPRFDA